MGEARHAMKNGEELRREQEERQRVTAETVKVAREKAEAEQSAHLQQAKQAWVARVGHTWKERIEEATKPNEDRDDVRFCVLAFCGQNELGALADFVNEAAVLKYRVVHVPSQEISPARGARTAAQGQLAPIGQIKDARLVFNGVNVGWYPGGDGVAQFAGHASASPGWVIARW
jgi:hypothetical protein